MSTCHQQQRFVDRAADHLMGHHGSRKAARAASRPRSASVRTVLTGSQHPWLLGRPARVAEPRQRDESRTVEDPPQLTGTPGHHPARSCRVLDAMARPARTPASMPGRSPSL